jgi:hypothetical protein
MQNSYDFEVLKGDEIVSAKRFVPLHSLRAAWPIISDLAASHLKGCQIRVRNARGEIEILIGVATVKRFVGAKVYALVGALFTIGDPLDLLVSLSV